MTVQHPHADRDASPAAVTVGTDTYPVNDDGVIECPADAESSVAARLARVYGCDSDDLRVRETCDVVKTDGEVCGRDLPCRFHSED